MAEGNMDRGASASPCSAWRSRRPHSTPRNFMHENRETSEAPAVKPGSRPAGEGKSRTARMYASEESHSGIVRAEQHVVQEGQSPSGARMRSAISKSGGNASLAGGRLLYSGGQGVHQVDHHKMESEGHEEKYRAVIDGGHPEDEPVGQRWGKVESALWGRRRSHPPTVPRCLRTARYRRPRRDPRRTRVVLGGHREKQPYKRKR